MYLKWYVYLILVIIVITAYVFHEALFLWNDNLNMYFNTRVAQMYFSIDFMYDRQYKNTINSILHNLNT